MAKKKSAVSKILTTLVVVVLVLVLLIELGLRWFIGNELKSDFEAQAAEQGITVDDEPSISFGARPLLLGIAQGKIHSATIDTPETVTITDPGTAGAAPEVSGTPEATIIITGLDLDTNIADSLRLSTRLSDELILATVQQQLAATTGSGTDLASLMVRELVRISSVTSDPLNQSVEVEFTDGAARASLRPIIIDGQLAFEVLDSQLFGMSLPSSISDLFTEGIRDSVQEVTGGLQFESIEIVEGGISITMTGQNIDINSF